MASNIGRYSHPAGVTPLGEAMTQLFRDAFTWPRVVTPGMAPESTAGGSVNCNLYEKDDRYILQILLPSVHLETLRLTAQQNVLTLQGAAGVAAPEGARGIWVNLGGGEFSDQVILPAEVDAENAGADYHDGVLTVTLPKAAHTRPTPIKISPAGQHPTVESTGSSDNRGALGGRLGDR